MYAKNEYYKITTLHYYDGIRKKNGQFQGSKFTHSIFNEFHELITIRSASKITKDTELESHDCQFMWLMKQNLFVLSGG
jgi:hypothetical protein